MRLPDFLLIGAARSGTTTLYRDLLTHPGIFFPIDKEPGNLVSDDVLTKEGRRAYARLFETAAADQLCGDATTRYTHLPDVPGVSARARRVLGGGVKCLYIVRNPVDKIVSTHHLYVSRGWVSPDINRAVREHAPLLDHARYAMQIEPWIEEFGADRVRVVRFESYISSRPKIVGELESFLGLEPRSDLVAEERSFNRSTEETRPGGPFAGVTRNPLYRKLIRPLLSADTRARVRRLVLPRMPERPAPPTKETVAFILESLAEDLERQPAVFGVPEAFWDFSE